MTFSSISTEPHPATRDNALLQRKGKPAAGIHSGPTIPTRPDTPHHCDISALKSQSHLWQGDIGNGPFDCNISLQPIVELRE